MSERIRVIYRLSEATYGMPRIHAKLRDMGEVFSKNPAARLMQLSHIRGASRRRVIVVIIKKELGLQGGT